MDSYLKDSEIALIRHLPRDTPYLIRGVSRTQLSIARYYGGIKYNGSSYVYLPNTDELIRDDVLKAVEKARRKVKTEERKAARAKRESVKREEALLFE